MISLKMTYLGNGVSLRSGAEYERFNYHYFRFFSPGIYSAVGCLVMMSTVSFKSDEHLVVIVFSSDCEIVSLSIFLKWL